MVSACRTRFLAAPALVLLLAGVALSAGGEPPADGFPLPAEAIARIGSGRLRHKGAVRGLSYSSDGKTIVSLADDNTLCLWDAGTGKLIRATPVKLEWHSLRALRLDGNQIDVLSNGIVRAIDVATGKELRKIDVGSTPNTQRGRFSADGALLALGFQVDTADFLSLRDSATGKETRALVPGTRPRDMVFSADGKLLAIARFDSNRIVFLDVADGKEIFALGPGLDPPAKLDFSPDGARMLVGSFGTALTQLWDVKTRKKLGDLHGDGARWLPLAVAFSPDSRRVAVGSAWRYTGVYDTTTGAEVYRLPTGPRCLALAFAADGRRLLAGTHAGEISQWDVATGKSLVCADPYGGIRVRHIVNGGKHLLADTDRLVLFDWRAGAFVRQYPRAGADDRLAQIQLSPDGKLLASPGLDGAIAFLDAETGKAVRTLAGHTLASARLLFAPDGKRFFSSGVDNMIRIWDATSGEKLHELDPAGITHASNPYEYLAVSRDGTLLATAASVRTAAGGYHLRVWTVASGKLLHEHIARRRLTERFAFTADGHVLYTLGGNDPEAGDVLNLLEPTTGSVRWTVSLSDTRAASLAIAPAGHTFAVGCDNGALKLYETATGRLRHIFQGHARAVDGVAFTDGGDLLAASSIDAPVYLWDIYGTHGKDRAPEVLSDALQQLWQDLAGIGAQAAFRAVRRLAQNPQAAVPLLREHLRPVEPFADKQYLKLLSELDSDDFDTRQQAHTDLEKLTERLEFRLREAATKDSSLEVKRRVQGLLARLDPPPPERPRQSRALEALEQMDTPQALNLLETLAAGERGAWLTREAMAALERVRRR